MSDNKYFDDYSVSSLKEVLADDFDTLLIAYRADLIDKLNGIATHYENENFLEAVKLVHSLKGSSGNMGALGFAEICANLEQALRSNNIENIRSYYQQLNASTEGLFLELDNL